MDINELQATIANLKLVIGLLIILVVSFLIYITILKSQMAKMKSQIKSLREDNRELIKRLEIISHGKVIN